MIEKAKELLEKGNYTCVICGEGKTLTATERGEKPLAQWLKEGADLKDCWAADKVVGKATAFLYCLLGVRGVYARVMSEPAGEVLRRFGIETHCDALVRHIINRKGDGICPFEEAVWTETEPAAAWQCIARKLEQLEKSTSEA